MRNATRHHIVPKSRNGSNEPSNIVLLPDDVHQAFHRVFGTDVPHLQLRRLHSINRTALSDGYRLLVESILEFDDPEYIYREGVLRPR